MRLGVRLLPMVVAVVLIFSTTASAQHRFEVTPYAGYAWAGSVKDGNYGTINNLVPFDLDVANSAAFGVMFDIVLPSPQAQVELLWQRQQTSLELQNRETGEESTLGDLSIDFIHAGIIYEFYQPYTNYVNTARVRPFVGVTLGATWYKFEHDPDDEVDFSAALVLGLKTFANERVALRIQSRLSTTYLDSEDATICDEFDNCYVLAGASYVNQIDLTAGITITF